MSVSISGELVFKVTFNQHGFPASMYTRAAIIHTCAGSRYTPGLHLVIMASPLSSIILKLSWSQKKPINMALAFVTIALKNKLTRK